MTKYTVLLTGGHLSPALALIPELKKRGFSIIFVGRRAAFNNLYQPGLEYQLLAHNPNLTFYSLNSGRFTKGLWYKIPQEILLFIRGFIQALKILSREKPEMILSFGGYLAVPVCLAAKLKGIEVRLHEQTIAPGRTNLLLSPLAQKVFVTFPESQKYFPSKKTVLAGIALGSQYAKEIKPTNFSRTEKPLLLIMGGSSGSHSINLLIEQLLSRLIKHYQIVHQSGDNEFNDYERLEKKQDRFYTPYKYLLPQNIGYFYHQADLVVSRSGANTFFDLIKFRLPAVLIPLPWSFHKEQKQHAEILKQAGTAKIFNQNQPAAVLYELIMKAYKNRRTLKSNYSHLDRYAQLIKSPAEFADQLIG